MLISWIKTPSRPVIPIDYKQKSRLDQNTKKLDKVRQPDETKKSSYIKPDNLDKAREIQSEYSLDT